MLELAIRLGNEGNKDSRLRMLKCVINSTNAFCCVLMLGFSTYFVYPITYRKDYSGHNTAFTNYMLALGLTSGTMYSILTVVMIIAYVRVYRQLQQMIAANMGVAEISRNVT